MSEKITEEMLEKLILDEDLHKLTRKMDVFNIFEAVGAVTGELKHSNFLAYIFDPVKPHGYGDSILKTFLSETARTPSPSLALTPLKIHLADWTDAELFREWKRIDILIKSDKNKFICAIENKIHAAERKGQLSDYREQVQQEYAGWEHQFLFLTPNGRDADDVADLEHWISIPYSLLVKILTPMLPADTDESYSLPVNRAIHDYIELLRRHIVENENDMDELCRKIYMRHRPALDLIYEKTGGIRGNLYEFLKKEIQDNYAENFVLDDSFKRAIRFADKEVDPMLNEFKYNDNKWTSSNRRMLYVIENIEGKPLDVSLVIRMHDKNECMNELINKFSPLGRLFPWCTVWKKKILDAKNVDQAVLLDDEIKIKAKKALENAIKEAEGHRKTVIEWHNSQSGHQQPKE